MSLYDSLLQPYFLINLIGWIGLQVKSTSFYAWFSQIRADKRIAQLLYISKGLYYYFADLTLACHKLTVERVFFVVNAGYSYPASRQRRTKN